MIGFLFFIVIKCDQTLKGFYSSFNSLIYEGKADLQDEEQVFGLVDLPHLNVHKKHSMFYKIYDMLHVLNLLCMLSTS